MFIKSSLYHSPIPPSLPSTPCNTYKCLELWKIQMDCIILKFDDGILSERPFQIGMYQKILFWEYPRIQKLDSSRIQMSKISLESPRIQTVENFVKKQFDVIHWLGIFQNSTTLSIPMRVSLSFFRPVLKVGLI